MGKAVDNLLKNSGLPGPRGNLELLYSFSKNATQADIDECMSYYSEGLHNSPEEFVVMCGIVAYCVNKGTEYASVLTETRKYASHASWRIREAVAIGIQEMADENRGEIGSIIDILENWANGNDFEKRAIVAALCEPKLLKERPVVRRVLAILDRITGEFSHITGTLTDSQESLRKTLGYGWSVAIVKLPDEGRMAFEKLTGSENRHVGWIVRENLKKKRLTTMDADWVKKMLSREEKND